ncbi:MAG: hypothetical protein L6Q95_04315 [Planctomycetes bacterium]|nr:hypothetical protein [Planctomycetota bacterium]
MRALLLVLPLVAAAAAEDPLEERLAEKLGKPFARNAAWVRSFAGAKEQAAGNGKVIFAYFSRSYAP